MVTVLDQDVQLELIAVPGYEKVVKVDCPSVGLRAIICIHNSCMGPALGGTRIYPYATFEEALEDVKRLAKGMTYKSAIAECGWGGGKSVIIADPRTQKTPELLRAFGSAVNQLQGEYICAEDVGCTPSDMAIISQTTPYVVGLIHSKSSGDPSPFTAWGTYRGIQAVLKKIYGTESVEGRTVAIQGMGSVGAKVAQILFWAGARLIIADTDAEKVAAVAKQTCAQVVSPQEIVMASCDVFSPCAMGGILNEKTIPLMQCKAVAGAANNQLLKDADADALAAKGILYAPDFLINSGGLINVTQELEAVGYQPCSSRNKVHAIYDQLLTIFDIAEQKLCSTHHAALSLCEYRLKYQLGKRVESPCFHHTK